MECFSSVTAASQSEPVSFAERSIDVSLRSKRFRGTKSGETGRVLSIMPNWLVRDQWEYLWKMERHFPIKLGQPIEMAVVILNSSTEFPY